MGLTSTIPVRPGSARIRELVGLGIALLLAYGMWVYVQGVRLPIERAHYAAIGQPMDIGDLYPRWHGAHELLLHGRDPYGPEVSGEIQVAYYGHALDRSPADRGRDEQRFAYPVYVVFFLAPTLGLPFPEAQVVIGWALALLAAASLLLWLRALAWRPPVTVVLTMIVLILSSAPMVQAFRLQQLAVLVAFCLAGCAVLVARGRFIWAGCLLAGATIKPQLALLPVVWFLIWATGDWENRQRLVWGFGGSMAVLVGAGEIVLPGWLGRFIQGLIAYRHYAGMSSLLDAYLTPRIATPLALVSIGILVWSCLRWRRGSERDASFAVRLSLVLAVAIITLPPLLPPFNQVLLVPGLLALLRGWELLWNRGRVTRVVCGVGSGIFFLPWLSAGALAVIHLIAPSRSLNSIWAVPLVVCFAVPPVVAGLLMILLRELSIPMRTPRLTCSEVG